MTQHQYSRLPELPSIQEGAVFTAWIRSIAGDWNDERVHAVGTNLARLTESAVQEYNRARSAMDRGLRNTEELTGAILETATRLEICVCSLHRAFNFADKLCRLTQYEPPTISLGPQFWTDLEQLRHAIEHADERLSELDLRGPLPHSEERNATLIVKEGRLRLRHLSIRSRSLAIALSEFAGNVVKAVDRAGMN